MTLPAGLHYDIPAHEYHADPAPEPSLSQSLAKILLAMSPAHARHAHPRLNPLWAAPDPTKYDIGNIAHRLILGRGRELEIIPGDDWVKDRKAKSELRQDARERHKLAVLSRDHDTAFDMIGAAWRQLGERGYMEEWEHKRDRAEVVAIAQSHQYATTTWPGGHWLRCMIDWLPLPTRVWDFKTTHMSVARSIATSLPDWCIQSAMHERVLNLLDPDNAGRREHRFVVQEDFEPYALQVVRLTEAHMTVGRAQVARAEAVWARCMGTGEWPAYPIEDQSPEYPAWKMAQVMEGSDVAD